MKVAGLAIKADCRPVGVRNAGSAFVPRYVWKCACGAHGTRKTEDKAHAALAAHLTGLP